MTDTRAPPPADILLVEDQPAEIALLREAFTADPLPVHLHVVPGVEEALAFLRHDCPYGQAPRLRIVVTSLNLPRTPGLDLIAGIKGDPALCTIPVIVFTSYDSPMMVKQSYELGVNAYVRKPFGLDPFFAAVQTQYWLTVATPCYPHPPLPDVP
jgi:chemotaxis family two-component system response regulator Rcp1